MDTVGMRSGWRACFAAGVLAGFVGAALGMCLVGLHPVVEIQFDAFVYPALEQLVSQAARFRWRTTADVAQLNWPRAGKRCDKISNRKYGSILK